MSDLWLQEADLVGRAQRGDQAAYGELVQHYQRLVAVVALRMGADTGQAQDISQETFLRAWRQLTALSTTGRGQLSSVALPHRPQPGGRRATPPAAGGPAARRTAGGHRSGPRSGHRVSVRAEEAQRVRLAIRQLPQACQSALILREYGGLSYQEIAHALDIPMGTVMSRLNYARTRLPRRCWSRPMEHVDQGLLARYYDGELNVEVSRGVAQHLAACAECRRELAALRAVSGLLATQPDDAAGADSTAFWEALQPRLGKQTSTPIFWVSWLPGLLLLALQALVALAGGLATAAWLLQVAGPVPLPWHGLTLPAWLLSALNALPMWPGGLVTRELDLTGQLAGGAVADGLTALVNSTYVLGIALGLGLLYMAWLAAWCSRFCAQPATHMRRLSQ